MTTKELEIQAIKYLRTYEPKNGNGYRVAYSGGKDSDAVKILCYLAGVKFEAVHNHTTVDAPETVYYVRSQHDVKIEYPYTSMWSLIVQKKMPPTRLVRYCCSEFKERNGRGTYTVTGVRRAESAKRAESAGLVKIIGKPKTTQKLAEELSADYHVNRQQGLILNNDNDESRRLVEHCYRHSKVLINPIYDWDDRNVWEFLGYYGCKSNPLYECGFKRVGCIGCPMAGKHRYTEFRLYPKYKENYIKAFDRMIEERKRWGYETVWNSGEECFKWWMEESPDQLMIDGYEELLDEYNR